MPMLKLKPSYKVVKDYYVELNSLMQLSLGVCKGWGGK